MLQHAFEQAPVGIGVCDEDGRFVAVNRALAELLDRPAMTIVGRPFLTFVHPEERAASLACYLASLVAAASGQPRRPARGELRCMTGAGDVVPLEVTWTATSVDEHGHQHAIVHLSEPSTPRTARPTRDQ